MCCSRWGISGRDECAEWRRLEKTTVPHAIREVGQQVASSKAARRLVAAEANLRCFTRKLSAAAEATRTHGIVGSNNHPLRECAACAAHWRRGWDNTA